MATTGTMLASLVVVLMLVVLGNTCVSPDVKTQIYTTTDGMASMDTVFVVEFSLKCNQKVENFNLYAEIGGKTIPVSKTPTADNYQISFSDEHKNLPSGSYEVKLYDDEGFSALKKAQRSGETEGQIKPIHIFTIDHPGVWKGPLVQSEFVASLVAILVWYLAYTAKAKLQSN